MLRISVTESINYKGLIEYYNTPEIAISDGKIIPKKTYKHRSEIPLMYFTLYRMAKHALNKTLASGQHYCHDCSSEYRKPVHHYNNNYFDAFKEKYRRSLSILQRIESEHLH